MFDYQLAARPLFDGYFVFGRYRLFRQDSFGNQIRYDNIQRDTFDKKKEKTRPA